MITIINDGTVESPTGVHHYRVKINHKLITTFDHAREDGLATCLRKAADAVDASKTALTEETLLSWLEKLGI